MTGEVHICSLQVVVGVQIEAMIYDMCCKQSLCISQGPVTAPAQAVKGSVIHGLILHLGHTSLVKNMVHLQNSLNLNIAISNITLDTLLSALDYKISKFTCNSCIENIKMWIYTIAEEQMLLSIAFCLIWVRINIAATLFHAPWSFQKCFFSRHNAHFLKYSKLYNSPAQISNCSLLQLKASDFPLWFLAADHLLIRTALFTQGCVIARS